MGGRGAKSGGSPGQARPASEPQKPASEPPRERPRKLPDGRVEGVEYLRTPYPRDPEFGELTPLVSPDALHRMQTDMERIGMKAPLINVPPERLPEVAGKFNAMNRDKRAETLRKATQQYLKRKTGKKPSHDEVEEQLNLWGLTGEPFIVYHPPRKEIYEHPEKPQPKPETPTPPPQVEKTTEKVKREKVEKKTEAITWEEFDRRNDEKYTRSNPLMWSDSELKARNKERQPYAMIDDNKGKILVKDIYEYRGPLKRAGFEFDGYGWWYKPLKDRPSDNRKIVSALQKMNIPTRVTEGTAMRSLYSSDRAKEIYDTHGAEKGQEIIDKAAQKTLHKYGLI